MGKSKGKNRSEVEYLRGKIRSLEAELKYYKRRSHIQELDLDELVDECEVEHVDALQCPKCHKGILQVFDFLFATLSKCDNCGFEKREKKT